MRATNKILTTILAVLLGLVGHQSCKSDFRKQVESEKVVQPIAATNDTNDTSDDNDDKEKINIEIVAAALILEAGGEPGAGMQAVLNVIQNRAKIKSKTIKEIVLQKWQFSCFNAHTIDGQPLQPLIDKAKNHPKYKLAVWLVNNEAELHDVSGGATHYHRVDASPYWTHTDYGGRNKKAILTLKLGHHVFFKNID